MSAFHTPVLVDQVASALVPGLVRAGRERVAVFVDVTCGGAGHTMAVMEAARPGVVVALDRDPAALEEARSRLEPAAARLGVRLHLVRSRFSEVRQVLADAGIHQVTALLADLGVSSHQLDTRGRGFSLRGDAPLDMRMGPDGVTAAELLASLDEAALTDVLRRYGEEPNARRIARAILTARPTTTAALTAAVCSVTGPPHGGHRVHPATRTFQAIRILVNGELDELAALLEDGPSLLEPGGRMAVITFHSLEDRAVKQRFAALSRPPPLPRGLPIPEDTRPRPAFVTPERRGQAPTDAEVTANPRSRSSRLRVLERCAA